MDRPSSDQVSAVMSDLMASMMTAMAPVLEAVAGYRTKAIAADMSEQAAEALAVQAHGMLLNYLFAMLNSEMPSQAFRRKGN